MGSLDRAACHPIIRGVDEGAELFRRYADSSRLCLGIGYPLNLKALTITFPA